MRSAFSPFLSGDAHREFLETVRNDHVLMFSAYGKTVYLMPASNHAALVEIFSEKLDITECHRLLSIAPVAVLVGPSVIKCVVLRKLSQHVNYSLIKTTFLDRLNEALGNNEVIKPALFSAAVSEIESSGSKGEITQSSAVFQVYCQLLSYLTTDSRMRAIQRFVDHAMFSGGGPDFLVVNEKTLAAKYKTNK